MFRKAVPERLQAWGFEPLAGGGYCYSGTLQGGVFRVRVEMPHPGEGFMSVVAEGGEDEWRVRFGAQGMERPRKAPWFASVLKAELKALLERIAEECFEPDVFHAPQSLELMAHVQQHYGDELEYLWKRFPENAVWRRPDTQKWYGALLQLSRRKLGQDSDEHVEILDFRVPAAEMSQLVDGTRFLPGYHMNKRNWCTVVLDGSVPMEEIMRWLATSHELAR